MTKTKGKKTEGSGADDARGAAVDAWVDEHELARKQLLAQVAAHVAASVVSAPSKKVTTPDAIAEIAVDVAEAILQRVGL